MTIQQPTGGLGPDPAVDWDDLRRAAVASCRHIPPWVSRDDLVQEAYLAGWRAASRWQPDGGSSFTPYVIRRAVGAVRDVLRDHSPSTRAGAREPGGPPSATEAGRALTRFDGHTGTRMEQRTGWRPGPLTIRYAAMRAAPG